MTGRTAGQLINRGKNVWLIKVFLGRDDNGNKQYYNKTIHGNKKTAQQYLNEKLREQDMGVFVQPSKETLSKYLDKWMETSVRSRVRDKTFKSYEGLIKLYIKPHLGNFKLADLNPIKIQETYNQLTKQGLSPRTVRYTHSVLRNSLDQAVKWQMILRNPTEHVDLPKNRKSEMTVMSATDVKVFLQAAKETPWYTLFSLMITSGLRPGETLGLKWGDISFDQGKIHVQRSLSRVRGSEGWKLEEPKTARGRRVIPLPKSVIRDLQHHRKEQFKNRDTKNYENHDFVFAIDTGQPLHIGNLGRRYFKPTLEKAGLSKKIRLYDCRHTCATLLLIAGINPKIVSERLGHASVALTLDTYSHVLPDMQKGATEELERLLF